MNELVGALTKVNVNDWKVSQSLTCVAYYRARREAQQDILDYIFIFYNNRRLHSYLDYIGPNNFE